MTIYALDGMHPHLHDDTWVAPDANLIGQVVLEEAASVWFGATLRADNEPIIVGEGSNIQEDVVCHVDPGAPLTIGRDCTIGHKVMLHGCTIGNNSLIGMGAIILNHAVIGDNCLIGAGALITEGKEIPPGSLVMGAPGKVVRQLDGQAIARMTKTAMGYQQNMRRYRKGLTVVGRT
ncbi:gamma carbonic anhydrase family protein [Marinibacterium sp. SX1]|uniref:gamma carbonic anhydrase family protein n=1 Tax=Marinibacterium sp. SX1 TaxID=3388424 RepID=UPI003D18133E